MTNGSIRHDKIASHRLSSCPNEFQTSQQANETRNESIVTNFVIMLPYTFDRIICKSI